MRLLLLSSALTTAAASSLYLDSAPLHARRSLAHGATVLRPRAAAPAPAPAPQPRLRPRTPQLQALVGVGVQVGRIAGQAAARGGAKAGAEAAAKQGGKAAAKAGKDAPKEAPKEAAKNTAQNVSPLQMNKPEWRPPPPKDVSHKPGDAIKRIDDRWKDPGRKDHARAVGQEIGKAIVGSIVPGLDMAMPSGGNKAPAPKKLGKGRHK